MEEQFYVPPILLDTEHIIAEEFQGDPGVWENRERYYRLLEQADPFPVSIYVLAYNRLEKTKYCVECILKYTVEFDYELILIDNGSEDGTYEFFQSIPAKNKVVIKVNKNIGAFYPFGVVRTIFQGKYLVGIPNDVYVTKNWLSNLLSCMESDARIGFVMPMSSHVSNLQQVDFGFRDLGDMQEQAAAFNVPDPSKWEERLRLITILAIFKREVLDLAGISDYGFIHDFSEDDYAARLRRAGYKLILCGDTYVHHDHDFRRGEDKDAARFQRSLDLGRAMFREKYHGLDAWDDVLNFERGLISMIRPGQFHSHRLCSLCVDVRCGTPILEIRNHFRRHKSPHTITAYAFTREAKYFGELQDVADEAVCDRTDFIKEHYPDNTMDLILSGEPVNTYHRPVALVQKLLDLLKKGGILLLKIRNIQDYPAFLQSLGLGGFSDPDCPSQLPLEEFNTCLDAMGVAKAEISSEGWEVDSPTLAEIRATARRMNPPKAEETAQRLLTKYYLYCITK